MRKMLLIGTVLVLPMNAIAQTAQSAAETAAQTAQSAADTAAQTAQSLAESVPVDNGYRVAAIVAGAVVGAIVVSVVTGGTVTPVLLTAAGEAELATLVAEGSGVLIGAYIGSRVYDAEPTPRP